MIAVSDPQRPRTNRVSRRLLGWTLLLALLGLAASCGGDDREPIRVQASTVDGQVVIVDDLADRDTMLWFWAPW